MSGHENEPLVDEAELRELFAPRRPDPQAFREGVRKRIQRAEVRERADKNSLALRLWRRAAALLPLDPMSAGLAGSTLGKSVAPKLLPMALALPLILLGAALGGFFASLGSMRVAKRGAEPSGPLGRKGRRQVDRIGRQWSGITQAVVFGTFAGTFFFGQSWMVDALILLLLLSMGALVHTFRRLAEAGLLQREAVARVALSILAGLWMGLYLWTQGLRSSADTSTFGPGIAMLVVLLGLIVCCAAAREWWRAGFGLVFVLPAIFVLNLFGVTRTSEEHLSTLLLTLEQELDPYELQAWDEAAIVHRALTDMGAQPPALEGVRASLRQATQFSQDVHPTVWTAAYHMGLLGAAEWRALAQRRRIQHALDSLAKDDPHHNASSYYEFELPLLLSTRTVDEAQRDALARMLLEDWPQTGDHGALGDAAVCVRQLALLGRDDLLAELRPLARALIADHWVSAERAQGRYARQGGFTPNPERFSTSFADETLHALELMERFGVPAEVELHELRGYLRRECVDVLHWEALKYFEAEEHAALATFDARFELPQRSWLERLLAERLAIVAVLMVALCALAIRMAPPAQAKRTTT